METLIDSQIHILDASPSVKEWCEKHLILKNPEYAKKRRLGFWLGDTPEKIALFETNGKEIIVPFGCLKRLKEETDITKGKIIRVHDERSFVYHDIHDIPLYDYQKKAEYALLESEGGILQAPPGSGKTQIGLSLAADLGFKTLWITHTLDLLNQSKKRAEQFFNPETLGTIKAGKVDIGEFITFATVQTMSNLDLSKYANLWNVIIVDECHRVAGSPTSVTQFYKVLNSLNAWHKYGLSATVHRADHMILATKAILGEVVHVIEPDEVRDKIMRVSILPRFTGGTLPHKAMNPDGTLNHTKAITAMCVDDERNRLIVQDLIDNQNHSCLVLSDRLGHLEELLDLLPTKLQLQSVFVRGTGRNTKTREKDLEDMRTGKKRFLFATYKLAKEGLDIPCLDRLFLVTPQKDYAVVTQSVGRIARTAPGKEKPVVYDYVDRFRYAEKSYRTRINHYKKMNCIFLEEENQ